MICDEPLQSSHIAMDDIQNVLYVQLLTYAEEVTEEYQGAFEWEYQLLIKFLLRDKYWKNIGKRI